METRPVRVRGREIGPGKPVYIVAEMSANHNGDFERAVAIVRAAKEAGADAVKLQTYTPDTMTLRSDKEWFRAKSGQWQGELLYDLYGKASTPWEWHEPLKRIAEQLGLDLFSTPFDETAVDFLESLEVPAYKIASFEIVDLPLLERVARTGKPMIISTGMATLNEIEEAVRVAQRAGAGGVVLLKCTSAYPAQPDEMNLRTIQDLATRFAVPVGLSDHSLHSAVPVAAVALGASVIEKHLTLSRSDGGPDASFSLEPDEFAMMVRSVRIAEAALGEIKYGPVKSERGARLNRRSVFVVKDIAAGEVFTTENLRVIRPGYGLAPSQLKEVIGRRAARDIERGTPLTWEMVAGESPSAAD